MYLESEELDTAKQDFSNALNEKVAALELDNRNDEANLLQQVGNLLLEKIVEHAKNLRTNSYLALESDIQILNTGLDALQQTYNTQEESNGIYTKKLQKLIQTTDRMIGEQHKTGGALGKLF